MSNPLYNQINNSNNANIMQKFQQFKNQFKGNPQEQVQQLLNSGKMSQAQFNNLRQMAQNMFGIKFN